MSRNPDRLQDRCACGAGHLVFLVLLFCLTSLLVACSEQPPASKKEKITLLYGFDYGMSRAEVAKSAGADRCSDDLDSLCRREPASFFKYQWDQRFHFRKDKLAAVELRRKNSKDVQTTINKWLDSGYRFMPTLLQSDGRELDILAMVKQYGKDATRQIIQDFLKGTPLNATTTYIYGDFERKQALLTGAKTHATVLARAPRDFILIEESVSEDSITLVFRAPAAEKK